MIAYGHIVDAFKNVKGVGTHAPFDARSGDEDILLKDQGNVGHVVAKDFVNLVDGLLALGILLGVGQIFQLLVHGGIAVATDVHAADAAG